MHETPAQLRERKARALASHKPMTAEKQQWAKKAEKLVEKWSGGTRTEPQSAFDVILVIRSKMHGVEVKAMCENDNPRITMHPSSARRKREWGKETGAPIHTVVVDYRDQWAKIHPESTATYSGHRMWYRREVGGYHLHTMTQVKGPEHLRQLLTAKTPKSLAALLDVVKFDDDQPRDEHGRWGSGGESGGEEVSAEVERMKLQTLFRDGSSYLNASPQRRSDAKDAIVADLSKADLKPTEGASNAQLVQFMLDDWASTSGDSSVEAIAGQRAVEDVFGLKGAAMSHLLGRPDLDARIDAYHSAHKEELESYVKAEYSATQKYLKDNGIEHVTVVRGFNGLLQGGQGTSSLRTDVPISLQPASSFSTNVYVAAEFAASGPKGVRHVIIARAPAKDVLSTCKTGRGCLAEEEVLLLGKPMHATVVTKGIKESDADFRSRVSHEINMRTYKPKKGAKEQGQNIDAELSNADWPKQTDDHFFSEPKALKFTYDQPRDSHGRWGSGDAYAEMEKLGDAIVGDFAKLRAQGKLTMPYRARLKEKIVNSLSGKSAVTPGIELNKGDVQDTVNAWAESSGDSNSTSIAYQMAVKDLFGLKEAPTDHFGKKGGLSVRHAQALYEDENGGAIMTAYLKREYAATQKFLRSKGIETVTVVRGHSATKLESGKMVLQPASSFSADPAVAVDFAGEGTKKLTEEHVIVARVPAKQVLSTCRTGRGCVSEAEVILLGKPIDATVVTRKKGEEREDFVKRVRHAVHSKKSAVASGPEVNIDEDILNADWPKRTDDHLAALSLDNEERYFSDIELKYNDDQARDDHGRWGDGSSGASLIARPSSAYAQVNPAGRDTAEKFTNAEGEYSAERQALHEAIIAKFLAGKKSVQNPVATVLGGGPASGKSVLVEAQGIGKDNTVMVNTDDIRSELPEYREGAHVAETSGFTHEEASHVATQLLRRAAGQSMNIVLDGTGNTTLEKLGGKVAYLRSKGHEVVGTYTTVPVDVAIARADARGDMTGRYVAHTVIEHTHAAVSRILPEAIRQGLFDRTSLYDTSSREAKLIASASRHNLTVHDHVAWNVFLGKGKP